MELDIPCISQIGMRWSELHFFLPSLSEPVWNGDTAVLVTLQWGRMSLVFNLCGVLAGVMQLHLSKSATARHSLNRVCLFTSLNQHYSCTWEAAGSSGSWRFWRRRETLAPSWASSIIPEQHVVKVQKAEWKSEVIGLEEKGRSLQTGNTGISVASSAGSFT